MKPGRLQGGFNWYGSVYEARLAVIEGRTPPAAPIDIPTRVLWGAHDPVLKAEFELWKKDHPEVLNNQYAQLEWFFVRSPYFDKQKDVYPVGKIVK